MAPKKQNLRDILKKGQKNLKDPPVSKLKDKPRYLPTLKGIGNAAADASVVKDFFHGLSTMTDPEEIRRIALAFGQSGSWI